MKPVFDVTDLRRWTIQLNGLMNLDRKFTFYYDETNNVRKFYLKKSAFNSTYDSNFILGGVVQLTKECDIQFEELKARFQLQRSVRELKLKHFARGDFLNSLNSTKLNRFLCWLNETDLVVHFLNLNILYYSLVDIVDSIAIDHELDRLYLDQMRNDLYRVALVEDQRMWRILYKYEYPNIKRDNVIPFIEAMIEIISPYEDLQDLHYGIASIKQLFKQAIRTNDLPFIMDETDFILMKDFSQFYLTPLYLFKNSFHVFDREDSIEQSVKNLQIVDRGEVIENYEFVDSVENVFVQLSDVFVGVMGKYTSFIHKHTASELESIISSLSTTQITSLRYLLNLVRDADNENNAYHQTIESGTEIEKYLLIENLL